MNQAPVHERRSAAGDRIEVPVDRIAEVESRVPEQIEPRRTQAIGGGNHAVAHRSRALDAARNARGFCAGEESAVADRSTKVDAPQVEPRTPGLDAADTI
jgi:hypothetical protein